MSIRSVLRHRAKVYRAGVVVSENVPCLLDAGTAQTEPTYTSDQQRTLDRSGVLFTLPGADVRSGDRVLLTSGAVGTFLVQPDPATVATLTGPHHREHRVQEVTSA